jgi:hypothetical protein
MVCGKEVREIRSGKTVEINKGHGEKRLGITQLEVRSESVLDI